MKKISVLAACILFYVSVAPIVAAARIAGENDAKGFKWKWFATSFFTVAATPVLIVLTEVFNNSFLDKPLDITNPVCCLAIYGVYVLTPTAVARIHSPTPPADRLLGKSPEWINAYTKAYKNTTRLYRTDSSIRGCVVGGVVLGVTIYLLLPSGTEGGID